MKKRVTTAVTYEEGQINLRFGGEFCYFRCNQLSSPITLSLEELRFIAAAVRDYEQQET